MNRLAVLLVVVVVHAACGQKSPTSPTASQSGSSTTGGGAATPVRVTDELGEWPVSGVTPAVGTRAMQPSGAAGRTVISTDQAGRYTVQFTGNAVFTRNARLTIPAQETVVALIPSTFDLTAFDQMFRANGRLQRWRSAPPLVVVTRVVEFAGTSANVCTVLDEQISVSDRDGLVADLTDGLSSLSDGQFGGFQTVTFEAPAAGTQVNVMRNGVILVARSQGLTKGSAYWGYGRWAASGDGEIVGGNIMIDNDVEKGASPYRRSLRVHELGHALGYGHVTARQSVMNSTATYTPNAWDAQAVHIAFQRQPGSTTPDTDPAASSLNVRTGAVTWGPPMH